MKKEIDKILKEFDKRYPHQASIMFERNNIRDFIEKAIQQERERIIEECIKYIRSGKMAGSFSEGCDCEKCNDYEKKVRQYLKNA